MSFILDAVGIALEAIWANKLRSFLTVLGNIVAVASIVAVVSLIQGMNAYVTDAIVTDVGADSFTVERMGVIRTDEERERAESNPLITLRDAEAIRNYSRVVSAVMAQAQRTGQVGYREQVLDSVRIQGVTREYTAFATFDAERGRLMTPVEIARSRPVALLGWETADRLFGRLDPLDRTIFIEGVHFQVVGVGSRKGASFGQSQDGYVVVPLGAYRRLFGAQQSLALVVKPTDPGLIEAAMDDATVALRIERRLKPREADNFGMFTSETLLGIYRQATTGIFAVLVGVVALSLVVGGIVIMNIMLMVVTERTREIGLRKALGARRRDIVWQILTESITLSTAGGVVGTAVGFATALVISRVSPLPATLHLWSVTAGIALTSVVGLFFGLYPALRAAQLDPIEALRRE